MPVPKNCSMVEAAAIPEAFATAYLNLFMEGGIKEDNTLLMNAGASGHASVIIPMAKAFGIRVITTVLSDEIAASIKHLNADLVVNTSKENIAEVLQIDISQVNVKATTEEGLGFTGEGLGIASQAVCLLESVRNFSFGGGGSAAYAYDAGMEAGTACSRCSGCHKMAEEQNRQI